MNLELRASRVDAGDGARLIESFADEIFALYGADLVGPGMPSAGPAELAPPGGGFWVGYSDEQPVCCGGLKGLPDGAVEIKRMYVIPVMRHRGIGRWLLESLESHARSRGYRLARLDTGAQQSNAQALYESAGYRAIDNVNGHPFATYFGEKTL